jgi:hypothetical protein
MKISRKDLDTLCKIARELNEKEEFELWTLLNDVINNIIDED